MADLIDDDVTAEAEFPLGTAVKAAADVASRAIPARVMMANLMSGLFLQCDLAREL